MPEDRLYDGMYSVSIIEHLTAATRRDLVQEMSRRLRPGGTLILTLDLVRGGDALWNRNQGQAVEDDVAHGSFHAIQDEIVAAGLTIDTVDGQRGWGDVPVDIGLVVARK